MVLYLIDWIVFYAVSAIFKPYNGAIVLWKKLWNYGKNMIQYRKVWNFDLIWKKLRYCSKLWFTIVFFFVRVITEISTFTTIL